MFSRLLLRFRILHVRPSRPPSTQSTSRIEWIIGGSPLWFECADAPLENAPEAIACLCYAASGLKGWRVRLPEAISPLLRANLKKIGRRWTKWWDLPAARFRAKPAIERPAPEGRGSGVFLSLGVDSFYSLLDNPTVDTIIYVAGYDVQLQDTARLAKVEHSLRDIGTRSQLRVILLKTNLREHPVFRRLNWTRFHGAALAAAGHLLSGSISSVIISSSYPRSFFQPWGSSWKTDRFWSTPRLSVIHHGDKFWRFEKLERIADDPLVKDHLRVCWENRNDSLNCGVCEKCVRTMLGLLSLGKLDEHVNFPGKTDLPRRIRAIRKLAPHLLPTYRNILKRGLPPRPRQEVRKLLKRGQPATPETRESTTH